MTPRQNGRHNADDILKLIFLYENVVSWFNFHWNVLLRGQLTISLALIQVMVWRRAGSDSPLAEQVMMTYFIDAYMRHLASAN